MSSSHSLWGLPRTNTIHPPKHYNLDQSHPAGSISSLSPSVTFSFSSVPRHNICNLPLISSTQLPVDSISSQMIRCLSLFLRVHVARAYSSTLHTHVLITSCSDCWLLCSSTWYKNSYCSSCLWNRYSMSMCSQAVMLVRPQRPKVTRPRPRPCNHGKLHSMSTNQKAIANANC